MTVTNNKSYTLPVVGGDLGTWGGELNTNFGIIDANLAGVVSINCAGSSNVTVNTTQAQNFIIGLTGVLTGNIELILPAVGGFYIVENLTTGAFTITVVTAAEGSTGIIALQDNNTFIYSDATNVYTPITSAASPLIATGLRGSSVSGESASWTISEIVAQTTLGGASIFGANLTISVDLATTGIGGMDTGSPPAAADLSVYAAFNGATWGAFACKGTVSNGPVYSGSNLPSGYTYTALIWTGVTVTSAFVRFVQYNRTVSFLPVTILAGGEGTSYTPVSMATCVPANAYTVSGNLSMGGSSGCDVAADGVATGNQGFFLEASGTSTAIEVPFPRLVLVTPQTIYYSCGTAAGLTFLSIQIASYEF